jgi:hypothetical protein
VLFRSRGRGAPEAPVPAVVEETGVIPIIRPRPPSVVTVEALDHVADKIGGKKAFIDALRLVPNDESASIVARWDHSTPAEKLSFSIHQMVIGEGLNPVKVVAWIAAALYAYNSQIAHMLNAISQPAVMQAGIDSAQLIGKEGVADREMLLKISGILKDKSGALVNINVGAGGIESQEEFLKGIIDV